MVSHVYLENHDDIKLAFSINGMPVNEKLIDTSDKKEAFNNKNKFSFNVVCGDMVSQLKSCEVYKDNINYIRNNNSMKPSILSAHMIQASTFDNDGNFIKLTESEMIRETNYIVMKLINLSKFARNKMNRMNFKLFRKNNYELIKNKYKKK